MGDWLNEIRTNCSSGVLICLSGNKADIPVSQRAVSLEKALKFQLDNGIDYLTEASARNGQNILQLFVDISKFLFVRNKDI